MKYAQIRSMDISNGKGIGVSLFVQGCDFRCKGCFNQETWDWNVGKDFTEGTLKKILNLCDKEYITRLSILGGEPLNPKNISMVIEISKMFKIRYPNKELWIWTGYDFNSLTDNEILNYADYIIDGQFIESLKDYTLLYRGSSNQRVMKKKNGNWEVA